MANQFLKRILLSVPATTVMLGGAGAYAQGDAPAVKGSASGSLEEVIVTAQRREQSQQDVPVAMTALSAKALEANRVTNVTDLNTLAPNLTVVTSAGGSAAPAFTMRGLYALGVALGADRGIALYVDGVYIGSGSGSIFDFADLERIEVLRGPQGTLFGRNTTGGAISFVTRNPSGKFDLKQEFTVGNYDQFASKTRLETPQWGPLSAIFTYSHSERDGEIRNLGGGTVWNFTNVGGGHIASPQRLGDNKTDAASAAIKLDLINALDLVYKFDYTDQEYTPLGIGLLGGTSIGSYNALTPAALRTPVTSERPDAVNNWLSLPSAVQVQGHNITAQYQINDSLWIKNIVAYRKMKFQASGNQLDGAGGVTIGGTPASLVVAVFSQGDDNQFSNETQVILDTNLLTLTSGFLYYKQEQAKGGYANARTSNQGLTFYPGFAVPGPEKDSSVDVKSMALYAQGEVHVAEQWDIIAGARETRDRKEFVDNTAPLLGTLNRKYEKDKPSYLVGVNYKPTQDILTYAKYVTGFISGGQLAGLEYQPETAKSWEAGIKADWFDSRLRTNLALYHVEYANLQYPTQGNFATPPVIGAAQVLLNVGDARAKGFELETTFVPTQNWTVGASVGYLDFEFTALNVSLFPPNTVTTEQWRPEWTGNLSTQFESDPLFGQVTLVARVDASYKSDYFAAARLYQPATEREALNVEAHGLVNGRVALKGLRLGIANAELALWGKNLTDSDRPVNVTNFGGAFWSSDFERARTYGLDLTFDF
jgi:iron complex outermembrane receptor protein